MSEILCFNNFSYAYPDTDRLVLREVNLTVQDGECHCLGGATGSGKTSLALAAKGLLANGLHSGTITRTDSPFGPNSSVGIVLQNPETQLLTGSVGAEVAFGLENQGCAPNAMTEMITAALVQVGLGKSLDFDTAKLSMGEKYRLLVACQLAMKPKLLILDEPVAQLDPKGLVKLLPIFQDLKENGFSLLLCENDLGPLQEIVDYHWHLDANGRFMPNPFPNGHVYGTEPYPRSVHIKQETSDAVLQVTNMTILGDTGDPIWSDVSFGLPRGIRAALYGLNGAGKTTLLRCLLGFERPFHGSVRIFDAVPEPSKLRGKVGCLFQNPQKQLFETTVFDEVAFPLKRLRKNQNELNSRIAETLRLCRIEDLSDRSPHTLSYGQKHLVALASVLAMEPALLILDDPFAGLDPSLVTPVLELLATLNKETHMTQLLTSHTPGSLESWAELTLSLEGETLVCH